MNFQKTNKNRFSFYGFFIYLIFIFISFGCEKNEIIPIGGEQPCAKVDCGHGKCVVTDNKAKCVCDSGYEEDGLDCKEKDLCEGVKCSDHGACSVNKNKAVCACDSGYHAEELNCIHNATNPCEGVNCGGHGTCSVSEDKAVCSCEDDYHAKGLNCINNNLCEGVTCSNHGTCSIRNEEVFCSCDSGFKGESCEVNIDDCTSTSCKNGGICIDKINSFECNCDNTGYTGPTCNIDINECINDNPCQNNGQCINQVGSFVCKCKGTGYIGTLCENKFTCANQPCNNNGICSDDDNDDNDDNSYFECNCYGTGYTGNTCDSKINCNETPCKNDGVCNDEGDKYRCVCPAGYDGYNCENDINECEPSPCINGGECIDEVNTYHCNCTPGFGGDNCQININECDPDPCQNGGSCEDVINNYICTCPTGFEGDTCQININDCDPNPCLNNGECIDDIDSYHCNCTIDFIGTNCQTVNLCETNPCINGTCTSDETSYSCSCTSGYEGTNCDTNINDCNLNPCQNGGTCTDGIDSYTCSCTIQFTGDNCTICADGYTGENCDECADGYEAFGAECKVYSEVYQWGTSLEDRATSITVVDNKPYITGYTDGEFPGFRKNTVNGVTKDNQTIFLNKFEENTIKLSSTNDDNGIFVITNNDNIYIVGSTKGKLGDNLDSNLGNKDIILSSFKVINEEYVLQWTKQWGTSSDDVANSVAVDSNNNIYITGFTNGALDGNNFGGKDIFLTKFNNIGNMQWTKQIGTSNDDVAKSIAVDSNNNIYVTGFTNGALDGNNFGGKDIILTKFTNIGNMQWTKQWGTTSDDVANSITIDNNNNVYITGFTSGDLDGNLEETHFGRKDIFLTKFRNDGIIEFTKQFGDASDNEATFIIFDNDSLYITGSSKDIMPDNIQGSSYPILLHIGDTGELIIPLENSKINSEGVGKSIIDRNSILYLLTYNSYSGTYISKIKFDMTIDWKKKIKEGKGNSFSMDPNGIIHTLGNTEDNNIFLNKFDISKTKQWGGFDYFSKDDTPNSIVSDNNNVYIIGTTQNRLGSSDFGGKDIFITKYNVENGMEFKWTKQFGTAVDDEALSGTIDSNGYIYITGSTKGDLGVFQDNSTENKGDKDIFLMKLNSSGGKEWIKQWGTTSNDHGISVTTDNENNVYIAAFTNGSFAENIGSSDNILIKVDSSGIQQGNIVQFGTVDTDWVSDIKTDGNNVYVVGSTFGSFDGFNNLGSSDIFFAKFTNSLDEVWVKQWGTIKSDWDPSMEIDNNSIYIVSNVSRVHNNPDNSYYDVLLNKYDTDGNLKYSKEWGSSWNDYTNDISISDEHIYIIGYTNGVFNSTVSNVNNHIFLIKFEK